MDAQPPPIAFEQLPLARADVIVIPAGQYRVYTDQKSFKVVEADSAVHALEASGLQAAFKIEREAIHKNTLIFPSFAHLSPMAAPSVSEPSQPQA